MKPFFRYTIPLALLSILALTSCATSSHTLVGTARPAILPSEVSVLMSAPQKYEEIAEVKASSGVSLQSADAKWDRSVKELCKEAARVGANAIVLDLPDDDDGTGEVSAGGSKAIHNGNGNPIEVGLDTSTKHAPLSQSLRALAIYVPASS